MLLKLCWLYLNGKHTILYATVYLYPTLFSDFIFSGLKSFLVVVFPPQKLENAISLCLVFVFFFFFFLSFIHSFLEKAWLKICQHTTPLTAVCFLSPYF